ncbi:hypothetical protein ABH946_001692 [Bacillus sp. RC145]
MLRSLRLKIAVVFSVLISMMFVILGTAVYQLQKEKETHSLDQYSENTMDLVTEQLTAFMQRIEEDKIWVIMDLMMIFKTCYKMGLLQKKRVLF